MASISVNNGIIDKYFRYLRNLDNNSKKRLIIKLMESIEVDSDKNFDLKYIFGAWDDKDSDEIIKEIKTRNP